MAAAASPLAPDVKKPVVVIVSTRPVSEEILAPMLWGLEEEGIPVELVEVEAGEAERLAKAGADNSPLNVGIGIQSEEKKVALHHRDLPVERPLFVFGTDELTGLRLRLMGANAARLVKGEPLVFYDASMERGEQKLLSPDSQEDMEQLAQLVTRVVIELMQRRIQEDSHAKEEPRNDRDLGACAGR